MLWNRRAETLVLMGGGAALIFLSFAVGNVRPATFDALSCGLGVLSGALMMCTGAALDYLYQRNRPL